ncbi:hypothetical protein FB566_2165 [Stackebrandtia endophytica]|uniref:LPXTG-motif cell wall-anchored protein n=1 Tax=Stackebrandtia endophytica TaxID=1496996 RepID=A0A543AVS0_9ACTN|nr:hypothetical protein [Stackebrandtia endophytica]TQL76632.1 hypothetical protein FB566_2165 [Stackebrandtia endophytica]
MSGVAEGAITVNSAVVENVVNEQDVVSAEAYLHYEVTAELYDENGDLVYRGPLFTMNVGYVRVECIPPSGPTETPTETPSETPTSPTESPSETPTSPTETPTSPTEPPTESPTEPPTESPSQSPVVPTVEPTAPGLPTTGRAVGPMLVIGVVAIIGGAALLWLTRRQPTESDTA